MGNGTNETAAKRADLPGIVCNKEGQELGPAVMKDVTVLKHGKFNLFSIPKMLTQGWKLGGDREQIWIFKEDARIDFDIKIPTPKGTLYAMYFKRNMETGLATMSTGAKMEQKEIGIMPRLDENKMVQAGESEATQMTESLSESESVDDHSEAGERNGTNVRAEEARENDVGAEEEKNEDEDEAIETTRSGRAVTKPTRLIEEYGASGYDNYAIGLTDAEQQYYKIMRESGEFAFVGAGLGGGFTNTSELHVMKYKEAMASSDRDKWQKAVDEEHERMLKHNVWKPVLRKDVPEGAKILTSTWAMKKKANGTYHARMNA
jgi:hypothetical protein